MGGRSGEFMPMERWVAKRLRPLCNAFHLYADISVVAAMWRVRIKAVNVPRAEGSQLSFQGFSLPFRTGHACGPALVLCCPKGQRRGAADRELPETVPKWATIKSETDMKTFKAAILASLIAAPAFAGGYAEPVMEPMIQPEVIVEDTSSSSAGILVPILLLVLVAAVVSAD